MKKSNIKSAVTKAHLLLKDIHDSASSLRLQGQSLGVTPEVLEKLGSVVDYSGICGSWMMQVVLPRAKGIRSSSEVEVKFRAAHNAMLALTPVVTGLREIRMEEVDAELARMVTNLKHGIDLLFVSLPGDPTTLPDPPSFASLPGVPTILLDKPDSSGKI